MAAGLGLTELNKDHMIVTLWLRIEGLLNDYTLQQVMAILRALIMEKHGTSQKNAGEFYAVSNRGIFCSTDSGISWKALDIPWPREYYSQHPWSLAIQEE